MMEMDVEWVEVPAVHDPIVRTRFEQGNLLQLRGTKRKRVSRAGAAEHIWYPTRFPFFPSQSASTRFKVLPDAS